MADHGDDDCDCGGGDGGRDDRAGSRLRGGGGWVPLAAAVGLAGLILGPLWIGVEPVGGDPDLMYRPIKQELAAALQEGRLPYWSDQFGLGVPLVAESHAAAFYPLNWIAYGRLGLDVSTAYRLLMWFHFVACAAATFAYARVLGISGWGSALASLAFTLGGFQAAHACHEPFYTLMPFLPLCLLAAERWLATGRAAWLAGLALAWGSQILLGHFQIQMWTGGLVALTGLARAAAVRDGRAWGRAAVLALGLVWGLAVASVQLRLTSELTGVSGFDRPAKFMTAYSLPPLHLAQWALPAFYQSRNTSLTLEALHPYWRRLGTSPEESCSYIGVVALILACAGVAAGAARPPAGAAGSKAKPARIVKPQKHVDSHKSSRGEADASSTLWMWLGVSAAAAALATMSDWRPELYQLILKIPGFGLFRAPGRYMVLPSLGLALWAGRGLDPAIAPRRFRAGLLGAAGLAAAALVCSTVSTGDAGFRTIQGAATIPWRYAGSLLSWTLAAAAVGFWRLGRLGAWAPLLAAAVELGGLFYIGPTPWGWSVPVPGSSPMFARLKQEKDVGLVAGRLQNVPARAGFTVSYPIVGITAPPPNYLLEPSIMKVPAHADPAELRWLRRFGVTHGIWTGDDDSRGTETIAEGLDPVLSGLREVVGRRPDEARWKLVRYPDPFPPAHVATRAREAAGWGPLYTNLSEADRLDEAWFRPQDVPEEARDEPNRNNAAVRYGLGVPREVELDLGPRAARAAVRDWDGRAGTVEHDGSCVLVVRRAAYPGWTARVDDGPERPVHWVDGGLQGVVLTGTGPSRVVLNYQPTRLGGGKALSLSAVLAAAAVGGAAVWKNGAARLGPRRRRSPGRAAAESEPGRRGLESQ